MRRLPRHLASSAAAAASLVVAGGGVAVAQDVPVPTPVVVHAGEAAADGTVAWTPAVQRLTGRPGAVVAVDLALDDGTEHAVEAELSVRNVEVDRLRGPVAGGATDVLRLAVRRVSLRPGDRGVLRGVAVVPGQTTLVAVEARLVGDREGAAPLALVLVGPDRPADVGAGVTVEGGRAFVEVVNGAPFPTLVDVAVTSDGLLGGRSETQLRDVLVGGDGGRILEVALPPAIGRRTVEVAVLERGGDTPARVRVSAWPPRTWWILAAALLVAVAGWASVRALRRS